VCRKLGGLELLKHINSNQPNTSVMVLTQYGSIETAVAATRLGARDYVTKPFHVEKFRAKIERLVQSVELDHEIAYCASNCGRGRGSVA
jgi:DNA-binding NtrC family response regulator